MPTVGAQAVATWRAVGLVEGSPIHLERCLAVAVGQGTELILMELKSLWPVRPLTGLASYLTLSGRNRKTAGETGMPSKQRRGWGRMRHRKRDGATDSRRKGETRWEGESRGVQP